jgi:hypothetical protein
MADLVLLAIRPCCGCLTIAFPLIVISEILEVSILVSEHRFWRTTDEAQLARLYPDTPMPELIKLLGRPKAAIYRKARKLGLKRNPAYAFWSTAEEAELAVQYPDTPMQQLVKLFGRPETAIYRKARENGLLRSPAFLASEHSGRFIVKPAVKIPTDRYWKEADERQLALLYPDTPMPEIIKLLGRPKEAIYQKARKLGLKRNPPFLVWTASEEAKLAEHYPETPMQQLVVVFGRPHTSIYKKARSHGLLRSPSFFASEHSGRFS